MKAPLDTNIVIHREASRILNIDIGVLFRWLDKGKYIKCVHPITVEEIKKYSNKQTYGLNAEYVQEVENWYARRYSKLSAAQKANLRALGKSDDYLEL